MENKNFEYKPEENTTPNGGYNFENEEYDKEFAEKWIFGLDDLKEILTVDKDAWLEDFANIKEFYAAKIGDKLPAALQKEYDDQLARLQSL